MPLTVEEIKAKLLPKLLINKRKTVTWGTVVSSIAQASQAQKETIVEALKSRNYAVVGRVLSEIVTKEFLTESTRELDQMLANNSLNVDELGEILS